MKPHVISARATRRCTWGGVCCRCTRRTFPRMSRTLRAPQVPGYAYCLWLDARIACALREASLSPTCSDNFGRISCDIRVRIRVYPVPYATVYACILRHTRVTIRVWRRQYVRISFSMRVSSRPTRTLLRRFVLRDPVLAVHELSTHGRGSGIAYVATRMLCDV
eukprot:739753-Rhodomonas_salina.1